MSKLPDRLLQSPSTANGFTLIELLLVIAIIGLLAMVVITAINPAQRIKEAQDTQIRADLASMRNSLESYASANQGKYPATTGSGWWCENCTAGWAEPGKGANQWIPELVNKGYIKRLPTSPRNITDSCGTQSAYIYLSNGTDYKLIAHCTPNTGFNDGIYQPTVGFCDGSGNLNLTPDGNPQHKLRALVDPPRYTYSYSVFSPGAACW